MAKNQKEQKQNNQQNRNQNEQKQNNQQENCPTDNK